MTHDLDHDLNFDLDLTGAGGAFDIPSGDIGAVLDRARHRTQRRRAMVTGATAVALVAGTVTGFGLISDDRETPVAVGGSTASRGDSGLTWRRIDGRSALGNATLARGDGPLYALSTAPGQRAVPDLQRNRVLWRSDDGLEWRSVSKVADELYLSDLSTTSDRLYTVGTAPATSVVPGRRPVPSVVVGWSDDGGKSWQQAALPIDMSAISAKSTSVGVNTTQVAAGAKGVVAVAVLRAELDVPKVLPNGASAPNGWAVTATGVDVLGAGSGDPCPAGTAEPAQAKPVPALPPDGPGGSGGTGRVHPVYCFAGDGTGDFTKVAPTEVSPQQARGVVASYRWDELGLDADLVGAVLGQAFVFSSDADGTSFERVELPALESPFSEPITVHTDDSGFTMVGSARNDASPAEGSVGAVVLRSPDGRNWTASGPIRPGLEWFAASGHLAGRVALMGDGDEGPALLLSDGAGGWRATALSDIASPVKDGRLILSAAAIGPLGAVAVVTEAPEPGMGMTEKPLPQRPVHRLLTTRDGTTWQEQSLDDLAGGPVEFIPRVLVTDERAVITATLASKVASGGQDRPVARVTLVATPR